MYRKALCLVVFAGILLLCGLCGDPVPQVALAQQPPSALSRAVKLFKNQQYNDVVKVLSADVKGKPEADCAQQYLLLAESYYLTGQYGQARPYFVMAGRNLPEGPNRITAEQRLAAVSYRLGDFDEADRRIDLFISRHPDDRRVGKLLAYRMLILTRKGQSVEQQMEQIHQKIQENLEKYDYTTGMEADRILCDFYRKTGQEEKARDVYARIVHNFQRVIAERRQNGQGIPIAYERVHDNAALQLGAIYLEKKQAGEAIKWLENVRYDLEMKQQAKLLLAKLAYERRDFNRVVSSLTSEGYIDTVPTGRVKSDMYLLLGLAEKARNGNPGRVEEYLRRVSSESKGYLQAQSALGDIYREKGLDDEAIRAYTNVLGSPDHEPNALFSLGSIYVDQATQGPGLDAAEAEALLRKASSLLNQLFAKYPLSPLIRRAREKVAVLESKGIDVSFALGDEDKLKLWEKTARESKGTIQGAQALMSLVRAHGKAVVEQGSGRVLKPQNYAACAAACDQLLDAGAYQGRGFTEASWKALRAEAVYRRAQCEIASVAQSEHVQPGEAAPVYLTGATAERAIVLFTQAQQIVDPKQLDLVKGIELGLLESLFKSDKPENKEAAEKRFGELEADYGTDERFQQLALDLAGWYENQGRDAEAAWQYAGVADRGQSLDEEKRLQLLFTAGILYSQAANKSRQSLENKTYAVYIYPKEVVEFRDDVLKTYRQFRKTVDVAWSDDNREITAREALVALSKAAEIPFVWMPERGRDTIAEHLDRKRLKLENGPLPVERALDEILDLEHHRLVFDIGLTGAEPTFQQPAADEDDPELAGANRVIEIYDLRQSDRRYKPLTRPYGAFNHVHGGGSRSALLYGILQRIEELTETRVVWADGIDKLEKQAAEYKSFPNLSSHSDAPCARVLAGVLEPLELRYRIVEREAAADLYESAKDQFNKIRQINPKSKYGEKSLFALAINFYNQGDYARMKIVLREYLKLFDNPSYAHYRQACFWVGWAFEHERRYRDACDYYARAAEERLVVYKPRDGEQVPSRETLKEHLSYESQFALMEPVAGQFDEKSLADVLDFIHLNTLVDLGLGPSAESVEETITREKFEGVPAFDVLCDALDGLGLSFRVRNVDEEVAEKAYYRMASAYEKDNLMQQALENCQVILSRYPESGRLRDVYQLMLDIYKGLKDYRNVLDTLERLKAAAGDDLEKYTFDFEIGRIYFDMADYPKAAEAFKQSLAAARSGSERVSIRDGYAKALFRSGNREEALAQYATLAKEETDPLRSFVAGQMVFYLEFALGKKLEREYPEGDLRYLHTYEQLSDGERERLSASQLAKATWIYYVMALIDLEKGRIDAAKERLNAVGTSPDDFLAADALFRLGMIHMQAKEYEAARELFEHLLFATRSAESAVRATYALGLCWQELDRPEKAVDRFAELIRRYPISPYVESITNGPLAKEVEAKMGQGASQEDGQPEAEPAVANGEANGG